MKKTKLIVGLLLCSFLSLSQTINILIVAGGGSGGSAYNSYGGGGGGGGGQVIATSLTLASSTNYAITVGCGGAAVTSYSTQGNNGGNSSFIGGSISQVATGGGGGGMGSFTNPTSCDGKTGGNGGGAGSGFDLPYGTHVTSNGGTGTAGYNGGTTTSGNVSGSGGGGASAQGTNCTSSLMGGSGGNGYTSTITGGVYGSGGGGGGYNAVANGGTNGGSGAILSVAATQGIDGYGGGGGGAYGSSSTSGKGGDGAVIISFPNGSINYTCSGTSNITTTSGTTIIIYSNCSSGGTFNVVSAPTPVPWMLGGNLNTGNGSGGWYQIGSLDNGSDLPFIAGGSGGGAGATQRMIIKSNGQIGIGNTYNPTGNYKLDVNGDVNIAGGGGDTYALNVSGDVSCSGSIIHWSDKRFKNDIKKLESVNDKIKKLSGYTYNYNTDEFKDRNFSKDQQIGFIAQEMKEVFPQLVSEDKKGYLGVNYQGMIPVLLEAVKDLQKQVDELKAIINPTGVSATTGNASSSNRIAVNLSDADVIVLNQNVPNPFAEQTVITYSVPQSAGSAQILFYDMAGRQIKTMDVTKGKGVLNVYANDLTSGSYSYTLVVDGKIVDTKKMIKQ